MQLQKTMTSEVFRKKLIVVATALAHAHKSMRDLQGEAPSSGYNNSIPVQVSANYVLGYIKSGASESYREWLLRQLDLQSQR